VQALDCGQVHARGLLTLDLSALVTGSDIEKAPAPEVRYFDLFESPVHIKHLNAVVQLRAEKLHRNQKASLDILARALGINRMTVKRALGYQRLMEAQGLTEPYRVLMEAPKNAARWKRRRNRENSKPDDPAAAA
jgi:hypothetical protein